MTSQIAKRLRKEMTEAERRLWPLLKTIDIPHTHFRRQVPIGTYIADFACHAARLIVELDGGQHGEDKSIEHDAARTTFLESKGYKVLRFWNVEVFKSTNAVLETVYHEIHERMAGPDKPPPDAASRVDLPSRGR